MAKSRRMCEIITKTSSRFGGQNAWVPYFWDEILDDACKSLETVNGVDVYTFEVNSTDVAIFPELQVGQVVLLHDDGDYVIEIDPEHLGAKS